MKYMKWLVIVLNLIFNKCTSEATTHAFNTHEKYSTKMEEKKKEKEEWRYVNTISAYQFYTTLIVV